MKPLAHLALSAATGAGVWAFTGEVNALPSAVAAGFLCDVDHLLDYYNWYVRRDRRRTIVFLHAWELVAAGALVYSLAVREPWMLAVVFGYAGHVVTDQIFNGAYPRAYSLLARAASGFSSKRMHPGSQAEAYKRLLETLPPFIRPPLESWFESRVRPAPPSHL